MNWVWCGLALVVASNAGANIALKIGACSAPSSRIGGTLSAWTLLGAALFAVALICYAWVLRYIPLNVAQGVAAAQFVVIVLASRLLLGEPMPPLRWAAIALIAAGLLLLAYSVVGPERK